MTKSRIPLPALLSVLSLVWLCAFAGGVQAHATLLSSTPGDGVVLEVAPATFRLEFNEPVSPTALRLIAPDGDAVELGGVSLDGNTLEIPAPEGMGRGTHVLSWRVVSTDGHPVGGSVVFSVGEVTAGPADPGSAGADQPLRAVIWALKVLVYIGVFTGVGGVFVTRWLGGQSPAADRAARATLWTGLGAAILSLGPQGLDTLGLSLSALWRPGVWLEGAETSWGHTVGLVVLASLLALAALRGAWGRGLSLAGLVLVGLALTVSGHVATAAPHWLTQPAIFLHALAIAFWIGALIPLVVAFRTVSPEATAFLARFSRVIPWVVLVLVAAGLTMARIQVGGPQALIGTAYGRVFGAKLALLALLFLAAAWNRWRLTGPVIGGDAVAARRFRRSLKIELALVLAIFAVVALWRFTPPPRALAEAEAARAAAAGPQMLHLASGERMAMLAVAPARRGHNAVQIALSTMEGAPVAAQEVTLIVANAAAGIEPIRRAAVQAEEAGDWRVSDLILPVGGPWQVTLEALISDFDLLKLSGEVPIGD